jgi:release factor glutamine methyltransferase
MRRRLAGPDDADDATPTTGHRVRYEPKARQSAGRLEEVVAQLRAAGCVYAEDEARLLLSEAGTPDALAVMVDRRVAGEPLEQVIGWAEFCGLRVPVDPGVFVPRRRTEHLVRQTTKLLLAEPTAHPVVVDLCCGSGAIGAAVLAAMSARSDGRSEAARVELHSVDVDPVAVRCARRTVEPAGGRVYLGDLYEPLPAGLRGRVDLVLANAPYVPTEELRLLPPEAREHEPVVALDGGRDGLDVQRRVIEGAPAWLAPGGHVLVETGEHQASRTAEAVAAAGLQARVTSAPELGATVVIGTAPPPLSG